MEKREEALREALATNTEETERWQTYQRDNEQAINNLENFSKRLIVEVMVPLGPKAFSPGCLIHTNEVLVSHFQGYFSKCSAHTAKKICEKRVEMAKDRLEKLKIEAELWSNKLEKPYQDGVLPSAEQHEIVEDYDEEKEKLWREEHKRRVREAKLHEKQMRNEEIKTEVKEPFENFEDMFDEAEQMEELNDELNNLALENEVDTEEIIRKLLSGEMKEPPSKKRVAHFSPKSDEIDLKMDSLRAESENKCLNLGNRLSGIVNKSDLNDDRIPLTNNNYLVNPEIQSAPEGEHVDDNEESDNSDDSQVPEEAKLIEQQAQFLSGNDQIVFYQYQLQIIEQKILAAPITNPVEIEQKVHLFRIRERLEELLEEAGATIDGIELGITEKPALVENGQEEEKKITTNGLKNNNNQRQNKRISFALDDRTLEFRKTETVAEMLPKPNTPTTGREVIRLDDGAGMEINGNKSSVKSEEKLPYDRKHNILDKVERNLSYVAEQQSWQDFDLVNKIIDSTPHTLHIKFTHSEQNSSKFDYSAKIDTDKSDDCADSFPIPGSPADLYRLFSQETNTNTQQSETIFVNAYEGEDQVKVPVLREKDREAAYKDLRMEFSNPRSQSTSMESLTKTVVDPNDTAGESSKITKSILKNKNAVEVESHIINSKNNKTNTNSKKKRNKQSQPTEKSINEDEWMSAYNKVMKDVVEKPSVNPDPLPEGTYIDTFAPKKRVSRFKQMRSGVET